MKRVVVVVDDSRTAQAYAKKVLNEAGYPVLTASSALEAVPLYSRCDVVLMDYKMRGLQGDKATEFIKKNYPSLSVFLHTAESDAVISDVLRVDPTLEVIRKGDLDSLLSRVKKAAPPLAMHP